MGAGISSKAFLAAAVGQEIQVGFNKSVMTNVTMRMVESAKASWEVGTATQALLEFQWPDLSVFHPGAFPPPSQLNYSQNASDVFSIVNQTVYSKPNSSLSLVANDGSTGDPASIGVAVLLANWTRANLANMNYSLAAGEQLDYLLNHAPRSPQGAISHRVEEVQLWADFVYMAPPFIAYFGVLQGQQSTAPLLQIAYDQCRLYRDQLRDDGGLWRHVALGSWKDDSHWATGNAWAAAGMLRVQQTMNYSSEGWDFYEEQKNLTSWVREIVSGAWSHQQPNGTLLNVLDDSSTFADTASTALMAAVTYRLMAITGDHKYLQNANKALAVVQNSVDQDGWLTGAVNPDTFTTQIQPGQHSPEGQAFILLLQAAWRDYVLKNPRWLEFINIYA